ncbi:hypothetical protein [Clostridium sp. 001]|nr:hypothetical protein [Clostridium sp. 001]
MEVWKKSIFVNAIKALMLQENKIAAEVITRYTKLTDVEKAEILNTINPQ